MHNAIINIRGNILQCMDEWHWIFQMCSILNYTSPWNLSGIFYVYMMTSSNENIFRVTDSLCGEFTGHRRKGQWRRALMFSLICAWMNGWVNNRVAGDLRRHRAHNDVIVMHRDIIQSNNVRCAYIFYLVYNEILEMNIFRGSLFPHD